MLNNYEAPEIFDLGKTKEVILGTKGCCDQDPVTGEFAYDPILSEINDLTSRNRRFNSNAQS